MAIFLPFALIVSAGTLIAVTFFVVAGQRSRAGRILLRWAICTAGYVATVIAVPLLSPQRVLHVGDTYCDDDWCINLEGAGKTAAPPDVSYRLALRIFNQAFRAPQSAKGAWVYLVDERGRRFPPVDEPSAIPLGVTLQPGESVAASLTFTVPADARNLFFAGGLPGIRYASFIIGNGDLVHQPPSGFGFGEARGGGQP